MYARARFLLVSLVASSRRRVVVATRLFDEIMTLSGYLGRAAATARIIFSAEISRSLDSHVGRVYVGGRGGSRCTRLR